MAENALTYSSANAPGVSGTRTRMKNQGSAASGILHTEPSEIKKLLKEGDVSVAVIGIGRIGLPTAALFADAGARVVGIDVRESIVDETNRGKCGLVDEPGLPEIVKRNVKAGRLTATTDAARAVKSSQFVIVCVPTPVDQTKSPDYSAIRAASKTLGRSISKGTVVIVESTVGPGIVEEMVRPIIEQESGMKGGLDFGLASCPERSDPGNIVVNMKSVPRIVGSLDPGCTELVSELYSAGLGVDVIRVSSPKTANAVKLTENLFRDVNIALANEFALLFENFGIDTIEVINACATKYNFMPHYPGAGVGGPCLPVNSYYLIVEGMKTGNIPYLIRLAREINDRMPDHVVELTSEALNDVGKTIKGSKIAIMGVTYKPGVRDVQLSPLERVTNRLVEMGATVQIYDPMLLGQSVFGLNTQSSLESAAKGADAIIIGTAHKEFENLDLPKLSRLVRKKAALVDSRNVVRPTDATTAGFSYRGVGRRLS